MPGQFGLGRRAEANVGLGPVGHVIAREPQFECEISRRLIKAKSGREGIVARPGAGRSLSQTRFITACMSLVPLVIATTASCSGSTMQNWPNAPSPRQAP